MSRLNRAELQERNRLRVLAAAREEFAERGYRDAKIDVIAERAELTRGAVYSNFPGKRALYFAVLADLAEAPVEAHAEPGRTTGEALEALARAWLARLPLGDEQRATARLAADLLPEVMAEELTRKPYAQLVMLDAVLLGLALERLRPGGRLVRVAETVLTTLHGASQLAAAAPGFLEPFNVVGACAQLAYLDLADQWPELPFITPVAATDLPWAPPSAWDSVRAAEVSLTGDGVVAVLGLHRASAVEHAVRAAADGDVTAVLVTAAPAELIPLARLAIADLTACLRQAFPPFAWPRLRVVCDPTGAIAAAAGVPAVSDTTEVALRIRNGRVIARADGYGACHVVAAHHLIR